MSVVTGSLMSDISRFRAPECEAEMALLINDENGVWKDETKHDEETRINSQKAVLSGCMKSGCKIILVEQRPWYETCGYIKEALSNYPHVVFQKEERGFLSRDTIGPVSPYKYLQDNNIKSVVIMGGKRDFCVDCAITGDERYDQTSFYPGLDALGITTLTSPSLLSPYHNEEYVVKPFRPRAVKRVSQVKEYHILDPSWPSFVFNRGVRVYMSI